MQQDARRLEVVADGLPLFGGAHLAVDTTIVSTLHANGVPRRVHVDGVALATAQGTEVPRVGRSPWSCPFGGAGCGGLWPVVPRDAKVLEFSGTR